MEKQMRAERDKRAAVLTAEGVKQSAILTAQGEKEAQILRAEGSAQARVLEAQGQAQAIQQVFDAIHRGKPTQRLLAYQYLQVLPQLARGDANKMWIIPSELTDALRGVSSALGGNSSGAALEEEWVEPAPAPAAAPPIQRAKQFGEPEIVGDVHPPTHPVTQPVGLASQPTDLPRGLLRDWLRPDPGQGRPAAAVVRVFGPVPGVCFGVGVVPVSGRVIRRGWLVRVSRVSPQISPGICVGGRLRQRDGVGWIAGWLSTRWWIAGWWSPVVGSGPCRRS
jgi:hypothetical protein